MRACDTGARHMRSLLRLALAWMPRSRCRGRRMALSGSLAGPFPGLGRRARRSGVRGLGGRRSCRWRPRSRSARRALQQGGHGRSAPAPPRRRCRCEEMRARGAAAAAWTRRCRARLATGRVGRIRGGVRHLRHALRRLPSLAPDTKHSGRVVSIPKLGLGAPNMDEAARHSVDTVFK